MGGKNKLNVRAKSEVTEVLQQDNTELLEEIQTYSDAAEDDNISVYLWLLVFSVLMFTFPFLTFYGVRSWLTESFEFTTFETNCFSVLASVLVVNFIICLYVYKAFCESASNGSSSSDRQEPPANSDSEETKKEN